VTRFGGRPLVNSVPVRGQHHLRDGDVLSVGGLTLEFRMRAEGDHAMPLMSEGQRTATVRALT
jgi:hypothetical protein